MQVYGYRCSIIALDFIIYYDYKCSQRYYFQTPVKFQYLKEGFLVRVCVYIPVCPYEIWGFAGGTSGKEPAYQSRSHKRHHQLDPWIRRTPLEEEMATLSSILAWKTPWTEEPCGLQSMESQRVGHNRSSLALWNLVFFLFALPLCTHHTNAHPLFLPLVYKC